MLIRDIIKATNGTLIKGKDSLRVSGISIDSRTIKRGDLFIAIRGKNFDGHDFIDQVIKKSASAIVVSNNHAILKRNIPIIKVADTTKTLGQIARFHRDRFNIPVIAITGSAGKTTTKEMVATVLNTRYNVLKNIATQNNHIGVPLTLLKLNKSHDVVVVELGTNHFGEIRWLAEIANPTIALLTNIGESHLEFFKNLSGVFKEKLQMIVHMRPSGRVIFNSDDPYLRKIETKKIRHRLIKFGLKPPSDYQADNIKIHNGPFLEFRVNRHIIFILKTPAKHNVYNALAAISCGRLFKIKYEEIKKALKHFRFPKGRQLIHKIGPWKVIDDTYNANPVSVRSAIETLSQLNTTGRKILVCADMLELGRQSQRLHRAMGDLVASLPLDLVITIGRFSKSISQVAKKRNGSLQAYHYLSLDEANRRLKNYIKPGDTILLKGSRSMHMERMLIFLEKTARA